MYANNIYTDIVNKYIEFIKIQVKNSVIQHLSENKKIL